VIIDRYLVRQVARPFLLVCLVLILVFAGYSSAVFLGKASEGVLPRETLAQLIALKTLIAMEVLLPIALYLTVVVGLGRMYGNREMTALRACGVGTSRVLRAVLGVVVPVAVLAGTLSIFVRPWAYQKSYALRAMAADRIDLSHLEGGRFHYDEARDRVLFADTIDEEGEMEDVFLSVGNGEHARIFYAKHGRVTAATDDAPSTLVLLDARVYDLGGEVLSETSFGVLEIPLIVGGPAPLGYQRKAASTLRLARSDVPEDLAEFQWRLSRPVSTLLLGLLAVFLSRTDPRRGSYAKVFVAMLVYVSYYALSIVARGWVGRGTVGPVPGMWWVDLLLGAVVATLIVGAVTSGGKAVRR